MSSRITLRIALPLALLGALILLLGGCAAPAPVAEVPDVVQMVWPNPPEQPRIRYLGSLQSLADVAGEKEKSFRDILLGTESEESPSLVKPYGVHSDSRGRVFVADTGISGMAVFDAENKGVSFWGVVGLGALKKPVGVASDPQGNIYVTDAVDKRVVKYDADGNYLTAFGGADILPGPGGLVFNNKVNRLYVADTKRHQILVFDEQGELDFVIGERGSEEGQFNLPTNIAADANGRLYVADTMNFRVQVLESDGTFVRMFGELGDRPGNFSRLKGIGVDSKGHIYTVDASYNNFQIFDTDGTLLLFIGQAGQAPGQFYLPAGAYVDGSDKIYIADQYNRRIQMFQFLGD